MRWLGLIVSVVAGCGGTTGGALVSFTATASGPKDVKGGPLSFTSASGARVILTRAKLHVGAVYLNQSVPSTAAAERPCILPGIYVAQTFGPLDIDLLSPAPQPFPTRGEGTQTRARTAEVWLTGGDVNAADDETVILDLQGTAEQNGQEFPFIAAVTIGSNRAQQVPNAALPGAYPICFQRIVSPIPVDITPTSGGHLVLRIDPRALFNAVDFTTLAKVSDAPSSYQFPDTSSGSGGALFKGLLTSVGVFALSWEEGSR